MSARRASAAALSLAVLFAHGAAAETLSAAEQATLPRLIDQMCIDLSDAHPGCETALLLQSHSEPDTADLVILTRSERPAQILAVIRDIAFSGPMFGQTPSLSQAPSGALVLNEEQSAIGRGPWYQSVSIADGEMGFEVIALEYSTYDRALGGGFTCRAEYRSGTWAADAERPAPETQALQFHEARSGTLAASPIPLADWHSSRVLPAPCRALMRAWWEAEPQ